MIIPNTAHAQGPPPLALGALGRLLLACAFAVLPLLTTLVSDDPPAAPALTLALLHAIVAAAYVIRAGPPRWTHLFAVGALLSVEAAALPLWIGPGLWAPLAIAAGLSLMGLAQALGRLRLLLLSVLWAAATLASELLLGAPKAAISPVVDASIPVLLVVAAGWTGIVLMQRFEAARAAALLSAAQHLDARVEDQQATLFARLTDVRGVGFFLVRHDGVLTEPSPNLPAVIRGWSGPEAFWADLSAAAGLPTLWVGGGPSLRRDVALVDPSGAQRIFSITLSSLPAHTLGPRRAGRLLSVKDETERRARERALIEARDQLEAALREAQAANQAKTAFLAGVGHELRTPLNAILGYAELVQETAEDHGYTAITSDLAHIRTAGKLLRERITDLLDLTQIEAGALELCPLPLQLHALIAEVAEAHGPALRQGHNTLTLDLGDLPTAATADRYRLRQILHNLLSNAAKYTQDGQITLRGRALPPGDDGRPRLSLALTDTGIGISEHDQAHIFEEFYQSRRDARHRPEGAGIGLTISRRLARAMGGDLTVTSTPGQGSTFTLTLPDGP